MQRSNQEFLIDNKVQILLVAPVWFSSTSVGMPPSKRPSLLKQLQDKMNANRDCGNWELERFHTPRTLKLRKYGQLWRQFEFNLEFMQDITSIFGEDLSDAVFARLTLFDYGLGNVEVSVNLPISSSRTLLAIPSTRAGYVRAY